MIILDTNVLSAMMQSRPDAQIAAWLDRQPPESIWTTSVTVFEIEMGIALLTKGRRRTELELAFARAMHEDFDGRVLPFDERAAVAGAHLAANRRRQGRTIDFRDTQIAGIAIARGSVVATRNVRHFDDLPHETIDPWEQ